MSDARLKQNYFLSNIGHQLSETILYHWDIHLDRRIDESTT